MEIIGNISTTEAPLTLTTPALLNAGGTPSILSDLFANRPAFGTAGRLFLATDTNVLYRDSGTAWNTVGASGGSTTPGGSTNQIQYNNAGAFAGSANLTFDTTTNTLGLNGTDTGILLTGITNEPAATAANTGRFYSKNVGGRIVPKWIGPAGVDYLLQPHFGGNNIRIWRGGNTAVATTFADATGAMPYTGASPTAPVTPALAATNLLTQTRRSTISTGATAGALAYIRSNQTEVWRGNAAGLGGFFVIIRFALTGTLQSGLRAFAGLVDVVANPTNIDPTTTTAPGGIGLAIAANTGNWKLVNNVTGTARTALDLGTNFAISATSLLELVLFSAPNGSGISYRASNLSTNTTSSGTLTTNIPANTTFLAPSIWVTNNATAAAQTMDFVSCYVETDF